MNTNHLANSLLILVDFRRLKQRTQTQGSVKTLWKYFCVSSRMWCHILSDFFSNQCFFQSSVWIRIEVTTFPFFFYFWMVSFLLISDSFLPLLFVSLASRQHNRPKCLLKSLMEQVTTSLYSFFSFCWLFLIFWITFHFLGRTTWTNVCNHTRRYQIFFL